MQPFVETRAEEFPYGLSARAEPARTADRANSGALRVLGQGRRPTVHELAAEFRTRRETIYRDLKVLQDAGYPITGDEHGRLSRPRLMSSQVPEMRFSAAELDALLLAVAQTQAALPNTNELSSAALKVKALAESAPHRGGLGLDKMFETWTCGWKDYRAHESRIVLLIEAILRAAPLNTASRRVLNRRPMISIPTDCYS